MIALYAAAVFLGAALLFTVQPMFARLVLPVLGGAPGVWGTAQVFFQVTLLAGYGYAHLCTRLLGVRRQAWVHLAVLALPLLALPIGLGRAAAPPVEAGPVPWMLTTMLITVGPPFFALSAGGPLLQRWFAASGHPRARDPYFLYAASNLGSLLGLLAYPIAVEPLLGLRSQARAWEWLYVALVALMAACALVIPAPKPAPEPEPVPSPPLPYKRILRWVALAFVPSSLSLAATTHLTEDITSAPLLWIVPLALYLLTFVLAFARRQIVSRDALLGALPAAIVLGILAAAPPIAGPAWIFLAVVLGAFFVVAWVCHGELARDRPEPGHLTAFFFWVSLGGALGGAFAALLSPVVFRTVVEYSVTLVAAALLLPARAKGSAPSPPRHVDVGTAVLAGITCGAGIAGKRIGFLVDPIAVMVTFAAIGLFLLVAAPRPASLGVVLGVVLLSAHLSRIRLDGVLLYDRSFFGAFRVTEQTRDGRPLRSLYHGATLHGVQAALPDAGGEPLSYYSAAGPAGQIFLRGPIRADARIAVVGLGVGSLMAYAQPEQRWTFYEIDPRLAAIAEDPRLFTYLASARAPHEVVLGDARRSLARETKRYALLVLDAYSSDAVPVHLLTREAVAVYLARLEEGGMVALHVSNRHLDLAKVVAGVADALGLACLEQNAAVSASEAARGISSSHWALLARRREDFGVLAEDARWHAPSGERLLWTDDAASLLGVWTAW